MNVENFNVCNSIAALEIGPLISNQEIASLEMMKQWRHTPNFPATNFMLYTRNLH